MSKVSIIILLSLIAFTFAKVNFSNLKGGEINVKGIHYAVLVAGSNGFWNYRHQSDILHAYHILVANGIPKENIITFMYDDIANNGENPFPGKVFNKPDPTGSGEDVYAGVAIDYRGEDVTPENFLNVLEGKTELLKGKGTGKVLNSTETDNVFVYFSDHGATGLIAFPSTELYADKLITSLKNMHSKKAYKELVIYIEACESGSMFNSLLSEELNIYATTASTPEQSSWAIYCSPDDVINGTAVGSCLGDEYSVNWMEDADKDKGLKETLQTQFEHTRDLTKNSQVQQYGTFNYTSKEVGQYQGNNSEVKVVPDSFVTKVKKFIAKVYKKILSIFHKKPVPDTTYDEYLKKAKLSVLDSRNVKLEYLYKKSITKNEPKYQEEYLAELAHIRKSDKVFDNFNWTFDLDHSLPLTKINFECVRSTIAAYKLFCNNWGEYDLKYVKNMALACEKNPSASDIQFAFMDVCTRQ